MDIRARQIAGAHRAPDESLEAEKQDSSANASSNTSIKKKRISWREQRKRSSCSRRSFFTVGVPSLCCCHLPVQLKASLVTNKASTEKRRWNHPNTHLPSSRFPSSRTGTCSPFGWDKKKKKKEQENEGTATRGSGESPPFFLSTTQSVCSPNPTSTPRIPQTDNSKKSSDLDWRVKPRPNGLKFGANAFHWGIKDKHFERNRGLTDQKQLSGRCGGRHSCDFSDSRRRPVDPQQVLKHFHTCHERLKNCPLNGPGSFALVPQGERLIKGPPLDHRRGAEA